MHGPRSRGTSMQTLFKRGEGTSSRRSLPTRADISPENWLLLKSKCSSAVKLQKSAGKGLRGQREPGSRAGHFTTCFDRMGTAENHRGALAARLCPKTNPLKPQLNKESDLRVLSAAMRSDIGSVRRLSSTYASPWWRCRRWVMCKWLCRCSTRAQANHF